MPTGMHTPTQGTASAPSSTGATTLSETTQTATEEISTGNNSGTTSVTSFTSAQSTTFAPGTTSTPGTPSGTSSTSESGTTLRTSESTSGTPVVTTMAPCTYVVKMSDANVVDLTQSEIMNENGEFTQRPDLVALTDDNPNTKLVGQFSPSTDPQTLMMSTMLKTNNQDVEISSVELTGLKNVESVTVTIKNKEGKDVKSKSEEVTGESAKVTLPQDTEGLQIIISYSVMTDTTFEIEDMTIIACIEETTTVGITAVPATTNKGTTSAAGTTSTPGTSTSGTTPGTASTGVTTTSTSSSTASVTTSQTTTELSTGNNYGTTEPSIVTSTSQPSTATPGSTFTTVSGPTPTESTSVTITVPAYTNQTTESTVQTTTVVSVTFISTLGSTLSTIAGPTTSVMLTTTESSVCGTCRYDGEICNENKIRPTLTCENVDDIDNSAAIMWDSSEAQCDCPENYVLYNDECIPRTSCPCYIQSLDKVLQLGEQTTEKTNDTCTKYTCLFELQEENVSCDTEETCEERGMILAEPNECNYMCGDNTMEECESKTTEKQCVCAGDMVFDKESGRCVRPDQCSCDYYMDETNTNDCYEYACRNNTVTREKACKSCEAGMRQIMVDGCCKCEKDCGDGCLVKTATSEMCINKGATVKQSPCQHAKCEAGGIITIIKTEVDCQLGYIRELGEDGCYICTPETYTTLPMTTSTQPTTVTETTTESETTTEVPSSSPTLTPTTEVTNNLTTEVPPTTPRPDECAATKLPPRNVSATIESAFCVSGEPIELMQCSGTCMSTTTIMDDGSYEKGCTCCQPGTASYKKITMNCDDGTTKEHQIFTIDSCGCKECSFDVRR
ncbi:unnamed protein product [Owenia fusiformis]|uniref:CTCK domain-containing protein n=1 Tax=Owenia fusiformis TaxID=6347 RepID=A0A8S4P8S8_OWEFU|nr:unnamed protein product [Owenia fusiformis]